MIYSETIGRLGADSELKTSKNGNKFLSMRVATDVFNNGERGTAWLNVMWGGERAAKMAEHMKKGRQVIVRGELKTSTYQTKNGETAVSIDVFADRVDFVGSGNSGTTQTTSEVSTDTGTLKPKKEEPVKVAAQTSEAMDDLPF